MINELLPDSAQFERLRDLTQPILSWYDRHARVLPWRTNPQPYWVWLSEIMLQQTRIDTALPYFERFIAALPDVAALANADEARLLKLWEGLGYYNRIRNMQKAARVVLERFDGQLPASYDQLVELPGIGDYTAGAIASIAFNLAVPAVDGNVLRVLSRILGSRADIASPRVKTVLREAVSTMVSKERPGDFNQAMMDLGATVCIPNGAPTCAQCPVSAFCEAVKMGCAEQLPVKAAAKPRSIQPRTILVMIANGKTLVRERAADGLLPSLWEFPNEPGWLSEDEVKTFLQEFGIVDCSVQRLADAKHVFSHVEWHMRGYLIRCGEESTIENCIWVTEKEMQKDFALPSALSAFRKAFLQALKQPIA